MGAARRARISPTMPSTLNYPHARIRLNDAAIFADCASTDRDKAAQIVIERIHLGDFARTQSIDIRESHGRGRIEVRARGLDGNDETRLLAEVRRHRDFVGMDNGDGNQAALAAVGERD
jgi:hypothetical protein